MSIKFLLGNMLYAITGASKNRFVINLIIVIFLVNKKGIKT